jgi:hypothetical protein
MQRKNNRRGGKRSRRENRTSQLRKRNGAGLAIPKNFSPNDIPAIVARPYTNYRWRYKFLSAAATTISGQVLLQQILVATGTTTTTRIVAALRIREVEMWGPATLATGATPSDPFEMGVEWFGTTGSSNPSLKVTDIAMSGDKSHVLCRVPSKSFTEDWINIGGQFDNTNTIFTLNAEQGAVVDIVVQTQLIDNEAASAGPTTSGLTLGTVYQNYLDGRGSAVLSPLGGLRVLP